MSAAMTASAIFDRRDRIMLGMGGRMATSDSSADGGSDVQSTYRAAHRFHRPTVTAHAVRPATCGRIDVVTASVPGLLEAVAAEIEAHVGAAGWDQRPALFALVRAAQFAVDEPETAAGLGISAAHGDALVPIEQEPLPDGPLDDALAQIGWPASVAGCALSHEIVMLPPGADAEIADGPDSLAAAAAHPERREARLVVAVLRDGGSAGVLRLRGLDGAPDGDLLTGADLAPNLAAALLTTLD
jgi:hypothetical protein